MSANPRPGGNGLDDPQGHVLPGAGNTVEINGDIYNICQPREVHFHQAPSERSGEDAAAQRERPRRISALPTLVVRLVQLWLAIVLSNLVFDTMASAQPGMRVVGTWGGAVNAVFVDEAQPDIAYVGSGRRLVILNVADPGNIVELGSIDLEETVSDLKVSAGYAYVSCLFRPNSLSVINVVEPTAPQLVWSWDNNSHHPKEVDIYRNALYVRGGPSMVDLDVWDISDPHSPGGVRRVLGAQAGPSTIQGDLLYMADDFQHLRIYDLSADPLNPVQLSMVTLPGTEDRATGIAVAGNFAYVTQRQSAGLLVVVDVSDPDAPVAVGTYDTCWNSGGLAVSGGTAYLDDCGDLVVLDVGTNPTAPAVLARVQTHGTVRGVEVVGDRAYVRDSGEGLIVFDISRRDNPVRLGNWHSPRNLRKMDKVGDLLYVTDAWNGISILDVSDPGRPILVGVYQTDGIPEVYGGSSAGNWGLEVRDGLAYLVAGYAGFEIADVSDPTTPTFVSAYRPSSPNGIMTPLELQGDVAHVGYTACNGAWIINFDVSNPQNIVFIHDLILGGDCNRAYTIDIGPNGIGHVAVELFVAVADLAEPGAPSLVGTQPWVGGTYDIVVNNDLRYVSRAAGDPNLDGLYIQDVSDPARPANLGHYMARSISGLAVQNGLAYLVGDLARSGSQDGLSLIDVTEPSAPTLLAEVLLPDAFSVLVDGRYTYVACRGVGSMGFGPGLTIVEVTGLSCPGDLNGDGAVDLADLGILLADFGCTGGGCPGDVDGDGDTDLADLGILLSNFGQGCP